MNAAQDRRVPRIEDLPYSISPPIQFVYESTVSLSGGAYTWNDAPSPLTPDRPIRDNTLYYFRSIALSADISEELYESNLLTTAVFNMYRESESRAILFREPVRMVSFFRPLDYRYAWKSSRSDDILYAGFVATLLQGPSLMGRGSVTLKAVVMAQEVSDDTFVKSFFEGYPR